MENVLIFHVTIQIQILTMFSVQSKTQRRRKVYRCWVSSSPIKRENTMSTITVEMVSSRWQTNSLLPMPKISNRFISPQMSNFHTTCNRTCWTTWRKPWRRWTEKSFWVFLFVWFVLCFCCFLSCTVTADGLCIDPFQFSFVCTLSSWLMLSLL